LPGQAALSKDIYRKSCAPSSRRVICLSAAGCRYGLALDGLALDGLGLERFAQRAAEHDGRIVGARGIPASACVAGIG
jgi:hypothetical protein